MRSPVIGAIRFLGLAAAILVASGCTSSRYPEESEDGLVRVARTALDAAYRAPAFDLRDYRHVVVEKCAVRFRDNWLRDQNRDRGPSQRVTAQDMDRIKQIVGDHCRFIFAFELEKLEPEDATPPGKGQTLIIRPEIVELDITAPDVNSPGRATSFTDIPARMTLRLEIVDSGSGRSVGRVIDHRRADTTGSSQPTSSVGNVAEVERILRQWAGLVSRYLETPTEK